MAVANWKACTCSEKTSLIWISNTSLSILDPVLDPELPPDDADDIELVLVKDVLLDDLDTSEFMLRERLVLPSLIRLQVLRKTEKINCNQNIIVLILIKYTYLVKVHYIAGIIFSMF